MILRMGSTCKKIELKPVAETFRITRVTVMRSCVKVIIRFCLNENILIDC